MKKQDFSNIEKKIIQQQPVYKKAPREQFMFSAKNRLINKLILIEEKRGERSIWKFSSKFAAALLIYVVGIGLGVIIASERTIPGQLLYPVKRFNESLIVGTAIGPEQKALVKVEITKRRVDELVQLVDDQQYGEVKKATQELKKAAEETKNQIEKLPEDRKKQSKETAKKSFREGKAKLSKAAEKSDDLIRSEIEAAIKILDDEEENGDGEVKGKKKHDQSGAENKKGKDKDEDEQ